MSPKRVPFAKQEFRIYPKAKKQKQKQKQKNNNNNKLYVCFRFQLWKKVGMVGRHNILFCQNII